MQSSNPRHNAELLQINTRRRELLQLQQATFGSFTPPHITTEIEKIDLEIARLEELLQKPLDRASLSTATIDVEELIRRIAELEAVIKDPKPYKYPVLVIVLLLLDLALTIFLIRYWLGVYPSTTAAIFLSLTAINFICITITFTVLLIQILTAKNIIRQPRNGIARASRLASYYLLLISNIIPIAALLLYFNYSTPNFSFDNNENQSLLIPGIPGWDARYEEDKRLGERVWLADEPTLHFSKHSLAIDYDLRAAPFNKAQIKFEANDIRINQELSSWIYLPNNAPGNMVASCFVLEPAPRYWFFQTRYLPLKTGQWNYVRCLPSDFLPISPAIGKFTHPLLAGFELKLENDGFYSGSAYFDDIVLR